jgi:translation initiation factor IF-1
VAQGPFLKVSIDSGVRIVASVSGHVARELSLEPGCAVTIALRPADLYVIPRG